MTQMTLLGPNGLPIAEYSGQSEAKNYKKAPPPKMGPAFGDWAGRDTLLNQMPGAAILQFDLNKLTLADFRAMKDHPQINASLAVLSFMMHGLDWWIECEDKKIADFIETNMKQVWTRFIRAASQSYWAGFSPIVIEYENEPGSGRIVINKFKDLMPEECRVNWKEVEGWAPSNASVRPKFKIYDGIVQTGRSFPIPVENTVWYPVLMENGNYYGRKLLRPAFASWYFSILIHLFANRYFERFGEPLAVGRAPFDDDITTRDTQGNAKTITGKEAMENILLNLRNRSVVVLPNDIIPGSRIAGDKTAFEYSVEYLESQLRGADFERYLARLDEEMSLGIFTPVLLFRTADVGSYNLGVGHMQLFMWMLNALAGDLKEYIDNYVIKRLKDINFGPNAPRAEFKFRPMGKENTETVRAILTELIRNGGVRPDLEELGMIVGLTLDEVEVITDDETDDPDAPADDKRVGRNRPKSSGPKGVGQPRATGRQISNRIRGQVENAWTNKTFGTSYHPSLGYRRRFEEALKAEGASDQEAKRLADRFFDRVSNWMKDAISLGMDEYTGPDDFLSMLDRLIETEIDALAASDAA